ncbi:MAG: helicase C-terminal domain-containing protein [Planctomycetota bacterium]
MHLDDPATPARACFTDAARQHLRDAIQSAAGNEVFAFGRLDERHVVSGIEVIARGNASAVPVFLERAGDSRVLIHNHPSGQLLPSPADLTVASEAGVRGLGFFIVDNDVERVYRVVEPFDEQGKELLDEAEIGAIFGPGGKLARAVPKFEDRGGQRDLAIEVARSFNRGEVVAFEAGTGVGKSYAYLVPAILWAVKNRTRVIVSTQTIALQEQLIHKDLPSLARVLDVEFTYALIKGRANYACRRKAAEVEKQPDLFADGTERSAWNQELLEWVKHTREGSRSDLMRVPPPDVWDDFASTTEQSLKVRCPHYRSCFYYEARRRASKAQIVVVNHHLFFADLAIRMGSGSYDHDLVVPGYQHVIFDEAHRLEDVAAEHFGSQISRTGLQAALGRLLSDGSGGGVERGRLKYVASVLQQHRGWAALEFLDLELLPRLRDLRHRARELFLTVRERCLDGVVPDANLDSGQPPARRVGTGAGDLAVDTVSGPLGELSLELRLLEGKLQHGRELVTDHRFEPSEVFEAVVAEFRAAEQRIREQQGAIDRFLRSGDGRLAWVEVDVGARKNLLLRTAPVRVAALLSEHLYRPIASVTMVSATLCVDEKWDFLGDRLGWFSTEAGRFRGAQFPSPFAYDQQACLALPTDLPAPTDPAFSARFAELVIDTAHSVGGRTFVLFTSHRTLQGVAHRVRSALGRLGLPMLVQGERPRSELLHRFREAGNAVLFGNQTFWEGVDVPGDALSCVIIARLPFKVPSHPLERARAEELEARGLNPFRHLTLPSAALTLKQGFGRLVRTREDRGVVIVADSRVHSARYGALFLRSLPECMRLEGAWSEIRGRIAEFVNHSAARPPGSDSGA